MAVTVYELSLLATTLCLLIGNGFASANSSSNSSSRKLGISLSIKDVAPPRARHECSKLAFNKCEQKFQKHVEAVTAFKPVDTPVGGKQDLWCQVLSSHGSCMGEVLNSCLADHPILSGKVQIYLKKVVHKACTHKGSPIVESCVKKMKSKVAASDQGKTLYDLASECKKENGKLEPSVQSLIDLLHNLQRSRHHLYKRLPDV